MIHSGWFSLIGFLDQNHGASDYRGLWICRVLGSPKHLFWDPMILRVSILDNFLGIIFLGRFDMETTYLEDSTGFWDDFWMMMMMMMMMMMLEVFSWNLMQNILHRKWDPFFLSWSGKWGARWVACLRKKVIFHWTKKNNDTPDGDRSAGLLWPSFFWVLSPVCLAGRRSNGAIKKRWGFQRWSLLDKSLSSKGSRCILGFRQHPGVPKDFLHFFQLLGSNME